MKGLFECRLGHTWAVLAALASVASCAAPASGPTEARVLDLVAERRLAADGKALRAHERFAADETWAAVAVQPRQRVESELDIGGDPYLTLRGCVQCEPGHESETAGALRIGVRPDRGRSSEFKIDLDVAQGWWLHEVDLEKMASRSVQLWLEVDLPEACSLLLREASVTHRVAAPPPGEGTPRQLLLISVDTLRNDAVGALGGGNATPHLDRFAADAEVWTRHYAAATWTKPSHASMLTGFHPETHRAIALDQAMDAGIPTMAERFRDAGFATAALVFDCAWLSPRWGFAKGFDSYRVTRWRAERQAHAAAEWILDHRDEDFFLFLHTFEPHSDFSLLPYEAPGLTRATIAGRFGVKGFGCRNGRCASQLVNGLHHGEVPVEPRDSEILRYSYDEGVRFLDRALGGLFERLRSSGVWDRMLVVVTSDHGEAFGERGEFGHNSVHEEIVRVPLMIKWPGSEGAGEVHDVPCSAVDVAPTLLGFAGLIAGELPGRDLRAPGTDAAVVTGTFVKAVIAGDSKGVFGRDAPARIYDLRSDPGEEIDLRAADPARARTLGELLREHRKLSLELYHALGSRDETAGVILSERERERLRAFGYLDRE